MQTICEEEVLSQRGKMAQLLAQQQAVLTNGIVSLGQGKFASPAGEAWALYTCRPVLVQGLDQNECYDGLPVRLPPDYEGILREQATNDTVYLAPISQLLTTQGLELPCVPQFARHYQNVFGRWMASTPALLPANTPKRLNVEAPLQDVRVTMADSDWAHSGVYSRETLDQMALAQMLPRRVEITGYRLTMDNDEERGMRPDTPKDTYNRISHKLGVPEDADLGSLHYFGKVYEKIRDWGYVLSFIVGLYSLFLIGSYVCSTVQTCLFPRRGDQGCRRWGRACCPALTELIDAILDYPGPKLDSDGDRGEEAPVTFHRRSRVDGCIEVRDLSAQGGAEYENSRSHAENSRGRSEFKEIQDFAKLRNLVQGMLQEEMLKRSRLEQGVIDEHDARRGEVRLRHLDANINVGTLPRSPQWRLTPSLSFPASSQWPLPAGALPPASPSTQADDPGAPRPRWTESTSSIGLRKAQDVLPSAPPTAASDSGVDNIYESPRPLQGADRGTREDAPSGCQQDVTPSQAPKGKGEATTEQDFGTASPGSREGESPRQDGQLCSTTTRGAEELSGGNNQRQGGTGEASPGQAHLGPAPETGRSRRQGWWTRPVLPVPRQRTLKKKTNDDWDDPGLGGPLQDSPSLLGTRPRWTSSSQRWKTSSTTRAPSCATATPSTTCSPTSGSRRTPSPTSSAELMNLMTKETVDRVVTFAVEPETIAPTPTMTLGPAGTLPAIVPASNGNEGDNEDSTGYARYDEE
jgi:hypothetical protein